MSRRLPQGLKPASLLRLGGTAEAVPFQTLRDSFSALPCFGQQCHYLIGHLRDQIVDLFLRDSLFSVSTGAGFAGAANVSHGEERLCRCAFLLSEAAVREAEPFLDLQQIGDLVRG